MDPIDIHATGTSQEGSETHNTDKLESVKYHGFDKEVYEFIDASGEKWYQQVVAERLLGVRTRQFDLYCKSDMVEKRRIHTGHYSYNFIKESEIFRIAKAKGKTIRLPLKDIATTDDQEKIFSKTDVETMARKVVNEQALAIFKTYDVRIRDLETKNDHLNTEVNRLTLEKAEIIETKSKEISQLVVEKSSVLDKKRLWANLTIILGTVLVIGGGVAAYFVYAINKDNDRLYDEKNGLTRMITSLNAENLNLNLKTRMQNDEIEVLKKQIPAVQNSVTNAVEKN